MTEERNQAVTEHHHSEHPDHHHEYHLIVDNKQHKWPKGFITGNEIKELAKVDPATYSVWEIIPGHRDDIEIGDHQKVDLKGHEKKFIVGKKHSTEGSGDGLPSKD